MLLRSSSTPTLTSLISERDHCSPLSKPFSRTSLFNNTALCLKPHTSMRRALSETDLQAFVDAEDENAGEKRHYPSIQSFAKLSIFPGKEQFPVIRAVQPAEDLNVSGLVACSSSSVFEDGKHCACATEARHSSASCAHALKEGERLGPLLMASEVGVCSKAEGFVACLGSGGVRGCDGGRGSSGGGSGPNCSPYGDSDITDSYYQRLLQSDPQNPLYLRNYAQYLSEAKHDHKKSEEYYERAILACPNDGEVLSKYANHVWDVHKDSERAGSYFDQAVKATPDDCYVLASYASFLWQSEDDDVDNNNALQTKYPPLHGTHAAPPPVVASA